MRKRFSLAAGLLVLVLGANGAAWGQDEVTTVTAGELARAFDQNALAAGIKYYDRTLRVTGKVNWISTNHEGRPYVIFGYDKVPSESVIMKRIQVNFGSDQTEALTEALLKMVGGEEWATECQMVERSYTSALPGTCSIQ